MYLITTSLVIARQPLGCLRVGLNHVALSHSEMNHAVHAVSNTYNSRPNQQTSDCTYTNMQRWKGGCRFTFILFSIASTPPTNFSEIVFSFQIGDSILRRSRIGRWGIPWQPRFQHDWVKRIPLVSARDLWFFFQIYFNSIIDDLFRHDWVKRIQPAREWEFWSFSGYV